MARLSVGGATDPRRVAALPFSGEGGGEGKDFYPGASNGVENRRSFFSFDNEFMD